MPTCFAAPFDCLIAHCASALLAVRWVTPTTPSTGRGVVGDVGIDDDDDLAGVDGLLHQRGKGMLVEADQQDGVHVVTGGGVLQHAELRGLIAAGIGRQHEAFGPGHRLDALVQGQVVVELGAHRQVRDGGGAALEGDLVQRGGRAVAERHGCRVDGCGAGPDDGGTGRRCAALRRRGARTGPAGEGAGRGGGQQHGTQCRTDGSAEECSSLAVGFVRRSLLAVLLFACGTGRLLVFAGGRGPAAVCCRGQPICVGAARIARRRAWWFLRIEL